MRHAVLGAGGIGGLIAAALARSGEDVSLLLRPPALARYCGSLSVASVVFGDFAVDVPASADLEDEIDTLWVATKATQLRDAVVLAPPQKVGQAAVVPLLNGVDHVKMLRGRYENVVAATIRVESERTPEGAIRQKSPFLRVDVAGAENAQESLRRAGIDCRKRNDEATMLWEKLVFLAPIALTTTALDAPLGAVRDDPAFVGCRDEAAAAARAAGAEVDIHDIEALHAAAPDQMQSSMQKDVAAGREPELDAIAGPILRLAAEHGFAATSTDALAAGVLRRLSWSAASPRASSTRGGEDWPRIEKRSRRLRAHVETLPGLSVTSRTVSSVHAMRSGRCANSGTWTRSRRRCAAEPSRRRSVDAVPVVRNDRVVGGAAAASWRRWAGWWFAMLYLVGVALTTYNQIPGVDQRLSDLTAFYGDSGNRLLLLIGGILLAFSAAFLLAFAAGFASSEPERDSQESFLARSAAGLFAACIAISSVALALVAAEVSLRSALQPPPELERWLAEFGYAVLLVPGMVAAAVMVWSLSRSALRAGLIPSIVAVAGYVVAVLCLSALPIAIASELFWSQLPLALWVVVAAAVSSNRSLSRAGSAAGGAWTSSASGRRALRSFGGRRQGG